MTSERPEMEPSPEQIARERMILMVRREAQGCDAAAAGLVESSPAIAERYRRQAAEFRRWATRLLAVCEG